MAIVAPNVGEVLLLKYMLNHTSATDVVLRLYTNDVDPSETDTIATYIGSEPTDVAYTPATLPGASWTVATVSGVTTASYASQFFSFSSGASTYGYFVTDNSGTGLLWAERFDAAPYNIATGGGVIRIDPETDLS